MHCELIHINIQHISDQHDYIYPNIFPLKDLKAFWGGFLSVNKLACMLVAISPHNKVSNYCRAKVLSFPKGKIRQNQGIIEC